VVWPDRETVAPAKFAVQTAAAECLTARRRAN